MYNITKKIYNGRMLIGYEAVDKSGKTSILTCERARSLAIQGALNNMKYNKSTGSLSGNNGFDARKLPHKQLKPVKITSSNPVVRYANDFTNSEVARYNKRYAFSELIDFLNNPQESTICAVYGLRRTGKTTLLIQALLELYKRGINGAYISFSPSDSLKEMYTCLDRLSARGIEYVFLDEVTYLTGFEASSPKLADTYARSGMHIVIAGTDSFVICEASKSELYKRIKLIHTSYISFRESRDILGTTDVLDYIRNGGVMQPDIFSTAQATVDYIDTAITQNLKNSLQQLTYKNSYRSLEAFAEYGNLGDLVEQAIQSTNTEIEARMLSKDFVSRDLGSAVQLLANQINISAKLDIGEITHILKEKLDMHGIKHRETIENKYVDELKQILIDLDVLYKYKCYINGIAEYRYVFIQPGLRYRQSVILVKALVESESFKHLSIDERETLCNKIVQDTEGHLLEDIVLLNFLKNGAEAWQCNFNGKEVDIVLRDRTGIKLIEVKRSSKIVRGQCKWLVDTDFTNELEAFFNRKVTGRYVLYLGDNAETTVNGIRVAYRNVSEALLK